ncbi:MAG TPA: phosphate signaling complex protein PhoU, partial [Chryseosolibacter sp.]|nr:phosphate signaling complex protein PhoU [Chryseosolibacter sp.]
MPAIEPELNALKDNLLDMLSLVITQMEKCKAAIAKNDISLAEEVISDEKKVNAQEIAIDRDCENILALFTPVATDLRLVLATLKITNDLERIGDNAKSLAKFLKNNSDKKTRGFVAELQIPEMLEIIVEMLKEMHLAFQKADTSLALKSKKKDEHLNEYHKKATKTTVDLIRTNLDDVKTLLTLFSLTKNLERA